MRWRESRGQYPCCFLCSFVVFSLLLSHSSFYHVVFTTMHIIHFFSRFLFNYVILFIVFRDGPPCAFSKGNPSVIDYPVSFIHIIIFFMFERHILFKHLVTFYRAIRQTVLVSTNNSGNGGKIGGKEKFKGILSTFHCCDHCFSFFLVSLLSHSNSLFCLILPYIFY